MKAAKLSKIGFEHVPYNIQYSSEIPLHSSAQARSGTKYNWPDIRKWVRYIGVTIFESDCDLYGTICIEFKMFLIYQYIIDIS